MSICPAAKYDLLRDYAIDSPRAEVTVVVPLYNYAHHVVETLDSIRTQNELRLDLIVVDDASRDDSVDAVNSWLESHESRFDRAMLVRHRSNSGLPVTRNTGVSLSNTPFFFPLDADNVLYPRCLPRCLEVIAEHGVAAVYTQLEHFGDDVRVGTADVWRNDWFVKGNYVDAMALIRRSAWEAVDGYTRMTVTGIEDYEFWCKIIDAGMRAIFIPEILCKYRVHRQSMLRTLDTEKLRGAISELALRHPWVDMRRFTEFA